jgi:hypothetical protein
LARLALVVVSLARAEVVPVAAPQLAVVPASPVPRLVHQAEAAVME